MGLVPVWVTPLDTFAITVDGCERYVNLARSPLNSEASAALARNKYVARQILERHNLQNIPFTLPRTQSEAAAFLSQHGTIIAKPVTGAGAYNIHIVTAQAQLRALDINSFILEKYIAGKEIRYLVLNDEVIAVHRSDYGTSVAADRPLQRISYPRNMWSPALCDLSLRIADMFDLKFAAVDYLIDAQGCAYILEINTMPGFKWFHAPSNGPVVDVARLFLESIINNARATASSFPALVASDAARAYSIG